MTASGPGGAARYERFEQVDWTAWRPAQRATLLIVRRGGRLLLIRKKRGLGAGKINGPGGRIEPGESPREAALREVREELLVSATGVSERGLLQFQFADGFSIEATVFEASGCDGEPGETGEAAPRWVPEDAIPYDEMWADDRLWMPHFLAGRPFHGRFLFDGDRLLGHELRVDG